MVDAAKKGADSNPGSHTMNYTCHVTIDFFQLPPLLPTTNSIQFFSIQLLTIERVAGNGAAAGASRDRTEFCRHFEHGIYNNLSFMVPLVYLCAFALCHANVTIEFYQGALARSIPVTQRLGGCTPRSATFITRLCCLNSRFEGPKIRGRCEGRTRCGCAHRDRKDKFENHTRDI